MHLLVIADSELLVARYSLDHLILDIVTISRNIEGLQIHIITNDPTLNLKSCISEIDNVQINRLKDVKQIIDHKDKGLVVHFGKIISSLKSLPHFFIPITTPNEILNISIFKRFILNQKFKNWVNSAKKVISLNDLPFVEPEYFEWSELSAAKDALTNGNNFILVFASVDNLINTLKEFSIFKKWQQSTMHLVFILDNQQTVEKANTIIKGYKFKEDISIHTINDLNNVWIASSYLNILERVQSAHYALIFNSIQYEVPLLFNDKVKLPHDWKSAGELVSFTEKKDLSNHFKLYYKDELYRQNRAKMGKNFLHSINQNRGSLELFNNIVLSYIK